MISLELIFGQFYTEVLKTITGQLFTKNQITRITSHTVGKYFSEFFPTDKKEKKNQERVKEATVHITEANAIIAGMQSDLVGQTKQLKILLEDIEEKKLLAKKYEELASTNQEKFAAFQEEIAESLRNELTQQSEQGKGLRRFVSVSMWIISLVAGVILTIIFNHYLDV